MIFNITVSSFMLLCVVIAVTMTSAVIIAHNSYPNPHAFALSMNSGLYQQGGDNNDDDIISVSTEEEEEGEEEETNNAANEQELCSKYFETCPSTPTPTPPADSARNMEEDFREKYLQENSGGPDANTVVQPVTPNIAANTTVIPQATTSTASIDNNKTSQQTQLQDNFQIYENPVLGMQLQYPSDWHLQEDLNAAEANNRTNATIAFFSPLRDSGFRIEGAEMDSQQGIQDSNNPAFLGTSVRDIVDRFSRQYPDFQIISSNATAIRDTRGNSIPAYQVVFSYTSSPSQFGVEQQQQQFAPQDKGLYGMFIFSAHNNRSYLIEAYSEISEDPGAQDRKYSNNLITQQIMFNAFEVF